ncbi:MAG: O-antigen ligase [Candidatus Moraniibacteriota bacterium]
MPKLQLKTQKYLILSALLLLPTYLIKIKLSWISFNALELLIAILFILWIFNKNTKYKIQNTKYVLPITLMFLGLVLSVIANKNYYVGLGAIKGWFVFPIIFGIIFYDALKKDESLLKKALLTLFFSGVAVSAIGIAYKFFGILTYDNRLKIFWDSPNQPAMFLAIPFLIGLFFVLREKEASNKRLFILSLAPVGLSLFFTFSYGAWLALAIALIVIFWLKYRNISQKKYGTIFVMILLILLAWASIYKYKSIANMDERSSLASRFTIWKSAGLMIENNPLFGIGPGNFQKKYLGYQKYFPPYLEWSAPQPHNIFLAFWLESGLIGLAGFVILLFYFFRDNKKAIRNDRDLGILFFGIMIYVLIHGLVDTTYWRNDLAVVFWMIIAGNLCLKEKKD